MSDDPFGLKDEEFWTDPWRNRRAAQRPLMQKGEGALLLGAPAKVGLQEHDTFPVAVLRVRKANDAASPFKGTAIVAVADLNTSQLKARLAFPPRRHTFRAATVSGRKDSFSDDDTAMISEGHTVDLGARLGIPAAWGEYVVTVILRDQVSNRCRMKLVDSTTYDDPAVERYMRELQAMKLGIPRISPEPDDPAPSYQRLDDSPELPSEPGIALAVERVNVIQPATDGLSTHCPLTASFRLPVRPHHLAEPPEGDAPDEPQATAVVPITLLLTGSADPAPKLVKLAVPSYEAVATDAGQPVATGYFHLDLCRLADLTSTPQTYFLYAFAGEAMTGPVPAAFVRLPESWETD